MMSKLAIPLAFAAVATLAACGGFRESRPVTAVMGPGKVVYVAPATTIVMTSVPVRAGFGKITLVADPAGPTANLSTQSVTLRMDDGSMQTIIHNGRQLEIGQDVHIRSDNTIQRIAAR